MGGGAMGGLRCGVKLWYAMPVRVGRPGTNPTGRGVVEQGTAWLSARHMPSGGARANKSHLFSSMSHILCRCIHLPRLHGHSESALGRASPPGHDEASHRAPIALCASGQVRAAQQDRPRLALKGFGFRVGCAGCAASMRPCIPPPAAAVDVHSTHQEERRTH